MSFRWFMALPAHRKVLLILAGGMVTLIFDAFVAHWSWKRAEMHWNQWPPVIYGVLATLGMMAAAVKQLSPKVENRILFWTGLVGLLVGAIGVGLHLVELVASLEGEEMTVVAIGQTIALSPPIFAPAAFSGVGLLLMVLKRLTGASRAEAIARARDAGLLPAAPSNDAPEVVARASGA